MNNQAIHNQSTRFSYIVIAHILVLLGYSLNKGIFFHQSQLWLLLLGWIVLLLPLFKKNWLNFNFSLQPLNLLMIANLISFLLFYFFDGGIHLVSEQGTANIIFLRFAALFLFLFYFVNFNLKGKNFFSLIILHLSKYKFIYLIFLALILRLATIFYSPAPLIDVFWVLDGGAKSLIAGSNPYSQEFVNVYSAEDCEVLFGRSDCKNTWYTYLPGTLIFTTIFSSLFFDPRVTYIFSVFGTAAIIFFLLRGRFRESTAIPELATLLILYLPLGLFVLEQSWVDPLSIFFLYLFVFFSLRRLSYWPYVVLGLMLSTKQTMWIFAPFLLRLRDINLKKFFVAASTFLLFMIPFLLWDYLSFIGDTVIYVLSYKPALHSLAFNTLARIHFYSDIPLILVLVLALALLIFLFLRTGRNLSSIIHSAVLFMFGLFLMRQGFPNYYYMVSSGIILLITLELYNLGSNTNHKKLNEN